MTIDEEVYEMFIPFKKTRWRQRDRSRITFGPMHARHSSAPPAEEAFSA